jgi:rubrerythrin
MVSKRIRCPQCKTVLIKNATYVAMGHLKGFSATGVKKSETCPACGASMDTLDIINGKYDVHWWQF